jgi:hypothetical protein
MRRLFVFSWFVVAVQAQAAPAVVEVVGRVVTWDGQPIGGARVAIVDPRTTTTADVLRGDGPTSAADGTFRVAGARGASVHAPRVLCVAAKGFAARQAPLPEPAAGGAAAGQPQALGLLVLPPGNRIVGRVRDPAGQPVAGALVIARDLLPDLLPSTEGEAFVCSARTSEGGIFDLPCALPSGLALTVEADGWFTVQHQPVAAGTPLEFELQPSGWIEGRVQDEKGEAVANLWVGAHYEAAAAASLWPTDAAGTFRVPLRHPGRWRLHAYAEPPAVVSGHSPLGDGPAQAVVLVATKPPVPVQKQLQVRAVTKGSGAAVRTFRAVSAWGELLNNGPIWLHHALAEQSAQAKPSPDGTVLVDGPSEDGQTGAVFVQAEGHAPLLQTDVAFTAEDAKLLVELQPEASLVGVVRDAADGKPIAGAKVFAQSAIDSVFGYSGADPGIVTAADGTFRVGQLGAGDWRLVVQVPGRPPAWPLTVALATGETKPGLVVDVPRGARLAGRIVGGAIGPGHRVSVEPVPLYGAMPAMPVWPEPEMFGGSSLAGAANFGRPLAADGSFAFDGLPLGHYALRLHLPSLPRTGNALSVLVDSFRLRAAGLQRDFDITGDQVRAIRGRLTFPGAGGAFENYVVGVVEPSGFGGFELGSGAYTIALRDGSFTLPLVAGTHRLSVVDLQLGIVVATSRPIDVRDEDVVQDLAVPLVACTVRLQAGEGAAMALVDRLEVQGQLAAQREGGVAADFDTSYERGRGVQLPRGATSVQLLLPPGDFMLCARSHAERLFGDQGGQSLPPLGKVEFTVTAAAPPPAIVLEIATPPEIPVDVGGTNGK